MLTQKEVNEMLAQLETMLPKLRSHYQSIEDDKSVYSWLALYNIGKSIDGVTDALTGLRGE